LTVLLLGLRFLGLCRLANLHDANALSESVEVLQSTLERCFDIEHLRAELQQLASYVTGPRRKTLLRQLTNGSNRATLTASAVEILQQVPAKVTLKDIARLADRSGLLLSADEQTDEQAEAAQARGDLFFEDVAGNVATGFEANKSTSAGPMTAALQAEAPQKLVKIEDQKTQKRKSSNLQRKRKHRRQKSP